MTAPVFQENLRLLFPELDHLPHADTLYRVLTRIDVEQLQEAHLEFICQLIKGKKFQHFLIGNAYPVAIDGTQKLCTDRLWNPHLLQRKKTKKKKKGKEKENALPATAGEQAPAYQYYVYVLEANLALCNGMTIPLLTEFLDYEQGDTDQDKQDCEARAFKRLAERLKAAFPRLPMLLLLDGLYPNGPVMELCVRQRCNLGARHRWGIETGFLVEKHQGYQYEHCFAQDWNAMKGYHYLMRIAHALNVLARFSHVLKAFFQQQGVRGFIEFLWETLSGPWLKPEVIRPQLNRPCQLRLE